MRRSVWSLRVLGFFLFAAVTAELWINSRALLVYYQGKFFFPTYGAVYPETTFGGVESYETNYRDLKARLAAASGSDFVIMPLIPYNPLETNLREGSYPPFPPSFAEEHFLGTDAVGRDILARLVYGFRTAILFALALLVLSYVVGIFFGALMGYLGGPVDMVGQRFVEVWSNVPFLYIIMIISSIMVPNIWMLLFIVMVFNWIGISLYVRSSIYKEKTRDYAKAATVVGVGKFRLLWRHLLPNALSLIITFIPFEVAGGIVALTSLDFLGFGLPPPTPSWGELLAQGTANLQASWMVSSVVVAMTVVLLLVTFVGEGIREAFDPKQYTVFH